MTIEEDDANLHVENNCVNQRFGTRNKAKSDARAENLGQRIKPDNTTLGVQGEEGRQDGHRGIAKPSLHLPSCKSHEATAVSGASDKSGVPGHTRWPWMRVLFRTQQVWSKSKAEDGQRCVLRRLVGETF